MSKKPQTEREYHKSHWMRKKEAVLRKLMREIQRRRSREKPQTIGKACQIISKRLARKPAKLSRGRAYSPSVSTLYRHYADWRKGEQFAKLYPRYRPAKRKARDEIVPYLLEKMIEADTNADAYSEVEKEWRAGFLIPGIGRLRDRLQPDETKALPVNLQSLAGHRFTADELQEIQKIHNARRQIARSSALLRSKVPERLGFAPIKTNRFSLSGERSPK